MSATTDAPLVTSDVARFRRDLGEKGWAVLSPEVIGDDPIGLLLGLGRLTPQYDGRLTFEVTYRKGFDDAPYSQSQNSLGAHTEAPSYTPPPKYLALHCHRQARCGSGQTLLADGIPLFRDGLSESQRTWVAENKVEFVSDASPGSQTRRSSSAHLYEELDGEPVIRFSYNLFRYGNVNPTAADVVRAESALGNTLSEIGEAGETYFSRHLIPVLVPDGCLLVWNNHRLLHGRGSYKDPARHLTRYWIT